jgi:PAS domain S-box-containing protein
LAKSVEDISGIGDSRLRRLFDANVVGILIGDNAGAITEANDAFLAMIGYSRDELLHGGIDWRRLTPPEWLPLDNAALRAITADGVIPPYEKEYVRKDGTRVAVSIGGARIDGTSDQQICYVIDLSAERAAQAALGASEHRYRILAEALPQSIMLADEQRGLVYVNHHYESYTGIPAAELNARWREPIHPDDLPVIERARATGQPYEVEYRLRRAADGAYRWHFARCLKVSGDGLPGEWLAAVVDIDDRKRAEQSLQFIERAGALLSQTLDLQTTFETLLDLVVPEVGDWAFITQRDDDGVIRTAIARHKDPAKAALVQAISGERCFRDDSGWGTRMVYETGSPQLIAQVTAGRLATAVNDEYLAVFEQLGFGSLVALPIFFGGAVIGSFSIISAGDLRTYTAADLPALEELARRAGFAIGHARAYERERRVSSLFQEAALPRVLPEVGGLTFDGMYQAGRQEALVGGDWYDAMLLADGRVLVSVGDVSGNGLQAEVIRGAAHVDADPHTLLDVADRALRSEFPESIVTAFVGIIAPDRATMTYASAGHVPALLRSPGGDVVELDAPGLPLGIRTLAASDHRTVAVAPGSRLLLYTDGLVEWSRDILGGTRILRERFADAQDASETNPARSLVRSILRGAARDDVAALIVTFAPNPRKRGAPPPVMLSGAPQARSRSTATGRRAGVRPLDKLGVTGQSPRVLGCAQRDDEGVEIGEATQRPFRRRAERLGRRADAVAPGDAHAERRRAGRVPAVGGDEHDLGRRTAVAFTDERVDAAIGFEHAHRIDAERRVDEAVDAGIALRGRRRGGRAVGEYRARHAARDERLQRRERIVVRAHAFPRSDEPRVRRVVERDAVLRRREAQRVTRDRIEVLVAVHDRARERVRDLLFAPRGDECGRIGRDRRRLLAQRRDVEQRAEEIEDEQRRHAPRFGGGRGVYLGKNDVLMNVA